MGKRQLTAALPLAVSAFALAAADAQAETTLRMMHQGDPEYVSIYQEVSQRFTEANPDIRIELIYTRTTPTTSASAPPCWRATCPTSWRSTRPSCRTTPGPASCARSAT